MQPHPRGLDLTPQHVKKFRSIAKRERLPWSLYIAQVDPDGLALEIMTLEIMHAHGVEAQAFHDGAYDDPQNQHIRELLKLDKIIRPASEMPAEGPIALLDSSKLKDARFTAPIDAKRIKIIIDHHQPDDRLSRAWRYVQIVQCGAATTIGWSLAKVLGVRLSKRACTLAAIGIHNDTNKFRSPATTPADEEAFAEASARGDRRLIQACHRYRLPKRYFDLGSRTYGGIVRIGPAAVSHPARRMRQRQSGFISRYADRMLQFEDAEISIAWCLTEFGLRASIRAVDAGFDLNRLINAIFGKGSGGAKHGSGGAMIPLAKLSHLIKGFNDQQFDDELIAKLDRFVRRRLEEHFRKTTT